MVRAGRETATSCVSWESIGGSSDGSTARREVVSGGHYRSIASESFPVLSYTAVGFVLSYPRAALLCANSAQIGFVEADESGLVERNTEVDLKYGCLEAAHAPVEAALVEASRR
jgi:hypothetical protein